jgi:large exoprotein involved in heme utilization and adhesion
MIFRLRSPRWCHSAKTLFRRDALSGGGIFLLLATSLSANPTGGTVAAGSATIAGQGTSAVTIHQGSNTAIINWQSFSINSGESTSFLQTGANSATLNRVLGGQTSLINGTLLTPA